MVVRFRLHRTILALSVLFLMGNAQAATVTDCTNAGLDAAIAAADGTITFQCPADSNIVLASDKVIAVNTAVSMANDFKVTLDGNNDFRPLHIPAGITVSIDGTVDHADPRGLIITQGRADANSVPVLQGNGGGIHNLGTLELDNVSVFANAAFGTGVADEEGYGGGIFNGNTGNLTVIDGFVDTNIAFSGGGIANGRGGVSNETAGGSLDIVTTAISNNNAGGYGGGLALTKSVVTIAKSTISGNTSPYAAGIVAYGNQTTLSNSTVSGNMATGQTGAVGGIATYAFGTSGPATATFNNVTIFGNEASPNSPTDGANLSSYAADGLTSTVNISNTIIANSLGGAGNCSSAPRTFNSIGTVAFNATGNNFDTDGSCVTAAAGNFAQKTPAELNLQALAANDGSTNSHNLGAGSVAIDAGDNATCVRSDQRAGPRPVDGNNDAQHVCDVGSVEVGATVDADGDGSPDAIEQTGANNGDADNNAVPDDQQDTVARILGSDITRDIVVKTDAGALRLVSLVDEPAGTPAGVTFPDGLISFAVLAPAANVTITLPVTSAPNAYYKYGLQPGVATPAYFRFDGQPAGAPGATIAANVVTLALIDGSLGDTDGVVDGVILDPGGAANVAAANGAVGGGSSGGGCAVSRTSSPFDPLLILMLIAGSFWVIRKSKLND